MRAVAVDQRQQDEEEEYEKQAQEPQQQRQEQEQPPQQKQEQEQQQEQLKPQGNVPLKSETKVEEDDDDDEEEEEEEDEEEEDSQTAGVDRASPAASVAVRISGATGPAASVINGIYEATTELSGDMPVYVKVGNGEMWLEYRAGNKQWQVKPTSVKGADGCTAFCIVPAKCLPEKCPPGKWQVYDGAKLVPQPAVTIKQKKRER